MMSNDRIKFKLESIVKEAEEIKNSALPSETKEAQLFNLRLWYSFYKKRMVENTAKNPTTS